MDNRTAISAAPIGLEVDATVSGNKGFSKGDGILVPYSFTSMSDNLRVENVHHGINAPGATDLGGNDAFGNGINPKCVGVTC